MYATGEGDATLRDAFVRSLVTNLGIIHVHYTVLYSNIIRTVHVRILREYCRCRVPTDMRVRVCVECGSSRCHSRKQNRWRKVCLKNTEKYANVSTYAADEGDGCRTCCAHSSIKVKILFRRLLRLP